MNFRREAGHLKFFGKVNGLSLLYALMLFMQVQLALNVYRISRITGWKLEKVNQWVTIAILVLFVLFSAAFVYLTNRYMQSSKKRYFTAVLWFPYFVVLVMGARSLWPMSDPGDKPAPVQGLLVIGALLVYPLYILGINALGTKPKVIDT
ncbi:hypothetical protein J7E73_06500 [Paenibacillus albidus]|uniref:hypothetical protein n=1 Tax=Paenibacillus albidus TaxID=2041023 RepID=UPI001BEAB83F|nr:hypothetical protein [Paenibacillus albidus]MBT2288792.1 hypothetical protein [Paenibacillus albidus]